MFTPYQLCSPWQTLGFLICSWKNQHPLTRQLLEAMKSSMYFLKICILHKIVPSFPPVLPVPKLKLSPSPK